MCHFIQGKVDSGWAEPIDLNQYEDWFVAEVFYSGEMRTVYACYSNNEGGLDIFSVDADGGPGALVTGMVNNREYERLESDALDRHYDREAKKDRAAKEFDEHLRESEWKERR